jgi:hypothetical protein
MGKYDLIDILGRSMASLMVCAILMTVCLAIAKIIGLGSISLLTVIMPLIVVGAVFIVVCIFLFLVSIFKGIWHKD